jgi:hypothetical protein
MTLYFMLRSISLGALFIKKIEKVRFNFHVKYEPKWNLFNTLPIQNSSKCVEQFRRRNVRTDMSPHYAFILYNMSKWQLTVTIEGIRVWSERHSLVSVAQITATASFVQTLTTKWTSSLHTETGHLYEKVSAPDATRKPENRGNCYSGHSSSKGTGIFFLNVF